MRRYRYRLYPTTTQRSELGRLMDECCRLWNDALEQRIVWWRSHGIILDSRAAWHPDRGRDKTLAQTRQLQEARRELGIEVPAQLHNYVLVQLDRAFQNFRRRRREGEPGGFPRFRARRNWSSLVLPSYGQSHEWLGGKGRFSRIRISGVGDLRVREHRPLPTADLGQATIGLRRVGHWEISIAVREELREPLEHTGRSVGVNRGVRNLIATSDGRRVEGGLDLRAAAATELRNAQKAYSRTVPGSAGREKARVRVAQIQHRVAAERDRILGQLARELVHEYDLIAIEDYATAEMIRGAQGFAPAMSGRIAEQGWSILERRLRDRCERHGKELVLVDPAGISQTCPNCGRETAHPLVRTRFRCGHCSFDEDRDVAAAQILLERIADPEMVRERFPDDTRVPDRLEEQPIA